MALGPSCITIDASGRPFGCAPTELGVVCFSITRPMQLVVPFFRDAFFEAPSFLWRCYHALLTYNEVVIVQCISSNEALPIKAAFHMVQR